VFLWAATLLTAGTAVWYYRKSITTSASNLVLGGILPGLGAAFMAFVIIYSLASGALNGIQIGFGFGFGFAVIGLILSFVARKGKRLGSLHRPVGPQRGIARPLRGRRQIVGARA
jgi:hypothetical protein